MANSSGEPKDGEKEQGEEAVWSGPAYVVSLCCISPSHPTWEHQTAQNRRELPSENACLSCWRHNLGEDCFLSRTFAALDLNSPCQKAGTCQFLRKKTTVSAIVPRDWQRQTAWQLAGVLAVMGIKWSGRGLLMPDRNNRNQLLWWERGHLLCQLQLGRVEGRDRRACLAWGAAVLLPILQPHCVLVWCPCLATFRQLLVGERSGERKTINDVAWNLFFCVNFTLQWVYCSLRELVWPCQTRSRAVILAGLQLGDTPRGSVWMADRAMGYQHLPLWRALSMMLNQSSVSLSLSGSLRSTKEIPLVSFWDVSATDCAGLHLWWRMMSSAGQCVWQGALFGPGLPNCHSNSVLGRRQWNVQIQVFPQSFVSLSFKPCSRFTD